MLLSLKNLVWGIPTVALITAFGLYFTLKSRIFQITGLKSIFKSAFLDLKDGSKGGVSAAAALSTALGGTVGIGSIAGVGLAISEGGPGSIFWMWVMGFFGCMLKYAEINVAVRDRRKIDGIYSGGAMYALQARNKKRMAVFFAATCIVASFCTGALTQSSAITEALLQSGISRTVCGAFIGLAAFFAVAGGRLWITKVSKLFVPAASFVYILMTLYIIIVRMPAIPGAFCRIFTSAFGLRQAGAGAAGYAVSAALKTGFTRGVFSTEAGMGSSPIVHSSSENATPHLQGQWGIIEIIADTFVFSTLTTLALMAAGTEDVGVMYGGIYGAAGRISLPALLAVFGFASIISWCFYAESCIAFLVKKHRGAVLTIYRLTMAVLAFGGAIVAADAVWALADIFNALMMFPNLYLLFILRKEIVSCFGIPKR